MGEVGKGHRGQLPTASRTAPQTRGPRDAPAGSRAGLYRCPAPSSVARPAGVGAAYCALHLGVGQAGQALAWRGASPRQSPQQSALRSAYFSAWLQSQTDPLPTLLLPCATDFCAPASSATKENSSSFLWLCYDSKQDHVCEALYHRNVLSRGRGHIQGRFRPSASATGRSAWVSIHGPSPAFTRTWLQLSRRLPQAPRSPLALLWERPSRSSPLHLN